MGFSETIKADVKRKIIEEDIEASSRRAKDRSWFIWHYAQEGLATSEKKYVVCENNG